MITGTLMIDVQINVTGQPELETLRKNIIGNIKNMSGVTDASEVDSELKDDSETPAPDSD